LTLEVVISSLHPGHGDVIVAMDTVNALLPLLMLVGISRGELVVVVEVVVVVVDTAAEQQLLITRRIY